MKFGNGQLTYELVDGWGRLPEGRRLVDVAGLAVDSKDRVYVFNRGEHPVIIFDREGNFITSYGEGLFFRPHGVCIGPDDALYCTDDNDHTVRKFSSDAKLLMTLGTKGQPSDSGCLNKNYRTVKRGVPPFNYPTNVAVSTRGEIYVSDGYGNARVHKFTPDGRLALSWGEPGTGPGQFNLPHGIAISKDGMVYVADRENNRIQAFDQNGKFVTQWIDVNRPQDLYIDKDNYLYIVELGNRVGRGIPVPAPDTPWSRLSIFDLKGKLLARWGESDYSLPGSFYGAHCICTDSRGDIYVGEVIWTLSAGNLPEGKSYALQKFAKVS